MDTASQRDGRAAEAPATSVKSGPHEGARGTGFTSLGPCALTTSRR